MDLLARVWSLPLEREFEAWIVHGLESYFACAGIAADVFAVSPKDERTWPADQVVHVDSKIIGLQIKRPKISGPCVPNNYSRLSWSLSQPPSQLARVLARPEIHYVLPTFINRRAKANAIHHCLFWRPANNADTQVWYENNKAKTYKCELNAPRWGLFLESVLRCDVGLKAAAGFSLSEYIDSLRINEHAEIANSHELHESTDRVVLALLPMHRDP